MQNHHHLLERSKLLIHIMQKLMMKPYLFQQSKAIQDDY